MSWLSALVKKNPSVTKIHCDKHDMDIFVYPALETGSFIDDDCPQTVIFEDTGGKRSLKRYVQGKCDMSCSTVVKLLNPPAAVIAEM